MEYLTDKEIIRRTKARQRRKTMTNIRASLFNERVLYFLAGVLVTLVYTT